MKHVFIATLTVCVLGVYTDAHAQSFHPIEIPPVSGYLHLPLASVLDVSPDGSRVAGAIIENGVIYDCFGRCTLPFVWTASGGTDIQSFLRPIDLYKTEYGTASLPVEEVVSVTAEAALTNGSGGYFNEPFVFAVGGNRLLREVNRASPALLGVAMSDDARVIIGSVRDSEWKWRPVRWTEETGITAVEVGQPNVHATEVSGDGRVVVGSTGTSVHDPYNRAFRWSESDGSIFLDPLSPHGGSFPTGVSTNGSVIVGTARGDKGYRAYRWTIEEGTAALALPEAFAASAADAVSGNGEIVVGRLLVSDGQGLGGLLGWGPSGIDYLTANPLHTAAQFHAMIWDSTHGTRLLKDVLVNGYGLHEELVGWSLVSASAMSANGNVIAGVGVNPAGRFQGWVVFIPEPHTMLLGAIPTAILMLMRSPRSSAQTRTIL